MVIQSFVSIVMSRVNTASRVYRHHPFSFSFQSLSICAAHDHALPCIATDDHIGTLRWQGPDIPDHVPG